MRSTSYRRPLRVFRLTGSEIDNASWKGGHDGDENCKDARTRRLVSRGPGGR